MNEGQKVPEAVRSMLLPLQSGNMLVPYSVVQEIIAYRTPQPSGDAPTWVLGILDWHRWRIPVVSAERLLGNAYSPTAKKRHIVVCNLLNGNDTMPCAGVVTQGIPQLVRVAADAILPIDNSDSAPPWVAEQMRFRGDDVWVPALDVLASKLASVIV